MFSDALNPYNIMAALLPFFGHAIFSEERAKQIAELIKEDLLKTKDVIDIQDVMEAYGVNAWVAHKALKLLEKEGVIVEMD
jgi:ribosomal protein S25